jgi:hypothetical protein
MRLAAVLAIAVLSSDAWGAKPVCSFASLDGRPLIGASSAPFLRTLGPATGGKLKGESAWGLSAEQFELLGLRASGARSGSVTAYGGRVFEAEFDYPTTDLAASLQKMEQTLTQCAERKTRDCWIDRDNNYYIVFGQGDTLALFLGNKRIAGPSGRDRPVRCLREHRGRR